MKVCGDTINLSRRATGAVAEWSLLEWDENAVRGLVTEAVRKKLVLFTRFRDISNRDLIQEGMMRAAERHKDYDPRRSAKAATPGRLDAAYATWITRGVNFRLLDIYRQRKRQAARDAIAGQMAMQREQSRVEDADVPWPVEPRSLAFWLREVYARAVAARPPKPRRGPIGYSPALAAAVGALMQRMKLTTRNAELLLTQRQDLRDALGLTKVPSHFWFVRRAAKSLPDNSLGRKGRKERR